MTDIASHWRKETMMDASPHTDIAQVQMSPPASATSGAVTSSLATRPGAKRKDTAPRWRITVAEPATQESPAPVNKRREPNGTPRLLVDRVLVQTSAGEQLEAILPYIDSATSGLVLSRGRMSKHANLRRLITGLDDRGLDAPIVFDPEGYRRHVATTAEPFHFDRGGIFAETLDENLSQQRALGVDVALTPTGVIRVDSVDALAVAAEQVERLNRDDVMLTVPLDARILDHPVLTSQVQKVLEELSTPCAVMLAGQLDPLGTRSKRRISAMRAFSAGPAHFAAFRTDFNAFDVLCHGGFTAAIGSGGSLRHAIGPDESGRSVDPEDESPSVLYERLASWWRGSKIAREHGRMLAPFCECAVCSHRRIDRFLSREHSSEARGHAVAIWQEWTKLILGQESIAQRAVFWKTFCQGRVNEHQLLSAQLKKAKPLSVKPAFAAWASLPARLEVVADEAR